MSSPIVTMDLADFGHRELIEASNLLFKYANDRISGEWEDEGVTLNLNRDSGYVFLSNEEYQCLMLNDDKLEMYYSCPECDTEGFWEDFKDIDNHKSEDCLEYINGIKELRGEKEDESESNDGEGS